MNKLLVIFCFVFFCNLRDINSEPLRKLRRVGPFPAYPTNVNPSYFNENDNYNNYDYDYLNNVSLGRLLQDDNSLIQQTEHLSSQVKIQIASKLLSLANRLQNAANILLDGTSGRRRLHIRPILHRHHKSRHSSGINTQPINNSNPPSRYNPINDDKRNPNLDQSSTPKSVAAIPPNGENYQNLPPNFLNSDTSSTSPKPSILDQPLSNLIDRFPKSSESNPMNERNIETNDAKKKRDLEENASRLTRSKRDVDISVEHPVFKTVTKRQLTDVSSEVKSGYDSVIKLLKSYIDDPPVVTNKQMSKRSIQRAGEILENIEEAKKIFIGIEDYVSRQYLENSLENRNQTDLLTYFDKIIRVEKNRIGQALNEYATQLAINYRDFESKPSESAKESTDEPKSSKKDLHVPSSQLEREYQNDDDFHYINERRREIERENVRNHHASHYNEVTREDNIRETPIRPEILVRRLYTPPRAKSSINRPLSRPTRRHSINIKPAYETSISAKEPIENDDERGYEMIEP